MSKQTSHSLFLLLTAFIWGMAFVAQTTGGSAIGAFSFNGIRCLIGCLVLLPSIPALEKLGFSSRKPQTKADWKTLVIGGICCGIVICAASNLQQVGITSGASAGKAGFLTSCYILLVPIFGLFLKKRCSASIWIAVVIAVIGLYLLCINGKLSLEAADIYVLIGSICWAFHILIIDHFSPKVSGVRLSCIQFLICGVLTIILAYFFEIRPVGFSAWAANFTSGAWLSLLYAGVLSCGIAYTLQIIGQDGLNPAIASLIMSLESVFSVIGGWLILHQYLSTKELIGCALIFAAVLLAQLPADFFRRQH